MCTVRSWTPQTGFWGPGQSTSGTFLDSSGGFTFRQVHSSVQLPSQAAAWPEHCPLTFASPRATPVFACSTEASTTRPSRVITVSIPYDINSTTCDTMLWAEAADAAAAAAGVVVSLFTFKFYMIPQEVCVHGSQMHTHAPGSPSHPHTTPTYLSQPATTPTHDTTSPPPLSKQYSLPLHLGLFHVTSCATLTPSQQVSPTACGGWSGMAYIGPSACTVPDQIGTYCRSWHRYNEPNRAWVHEIGHNLGTLPCASVLVSFFPYT